MLILTLFAFLGGIVTILSPCILPILPIVLSSSLTGGKRRPIGISIGFILSFTFFTLFLTTLVRLLGLSADILRNIAVIVIFGFGLTLVIPQLQQLSEKLFTSFSRFSPKNHSTDFWSGIIVGLSLGLLWTPCVGPILAAIITLAATSTVTTEAIIITLSYAIGTAIPLFAITYGGRKLLNRYPLFVKNAVHIQKTFGVLMLLMAVLIFFNLDRQIQAYVLQTFPRYGTGLTKLEDNPIIKPYLEKFKNRETMLPTTENSLGNAPEFIVGGKWFNSEPLTIKQLNGKVVLVDFWTYTCINCIRTLPYLKAWNEKYKNKGLVIVGVHTPEFEFEKNPDNVAKALKDFGLTYPVMQDNNFDTWNAYNNRYWPAKYLIDKNGKIRYTHFGEGEYDETEAKIQELLKETGTTVNEKINNPNYQIQAKTPETYLGYKRLELLASPEKIQPDIVTTYSLLKELPKHRFALSGMWTVGSEHALPTKGASLELNFEAQSVYLVMRSTSKTSRVYVQLDGNVDYIPDDSRGKDVVNKLVEYPGTDIKQNVVTVSEDRLYHLITLPKQGNHKLWLLFPDGNIELYAFTFG